MSKVTRCGERDGLDGAHAEGCAYDGAEVQAVGPYAQCGACGSAGGNDHADGCAAKGRVEASADTYGAFIENKSQFCADGGFVPDELPSFLFDFQAALVGWALAKGRAAIYADTGLGKSPMQLVWADKVARKTNGRVLILTPLAVSHQTVLEAEKFGIECKRSIDGALPGKIIVTNYERLHHFNADDFAGVVCDESSAIKNFEGARRAEITEFMRTRPYRLLCTATAAPNDFIELGTSSEALGQLGFMDMLARFFKNARNNASLGRAWGKSGGGGPQWTFKGHSEKPFWRWVASWARALRKPSDLGFDDAKFVLPPLIENHHIVTARRPRDGLLFAMPAVGLSEEREERRRTLRERCELAASLVVNTGQPAVCWAHLNDEGDLIEKLIPGAIQVSGRDSDEEKEEKFLAFSSGQARVLVTKPIIGAWGLNWQHAAHMTTFASHSYEQSYQSVRRMLRFGQKRPVVVDYILSDGEANVIGNLRRKSEQADAMHAELVANMVAESAPLHSKPFTTSEVIPSWL